MVPDLLRFYPALGQDETAQLQRQWRDLRDVVLALFAIPESLTGATFARQHREKEST